ncbi:MAG: CRTAC1 family protein [Candidatus Eisenbacteria bacterium]|uniref:CRTAC1 family protein n=1 Tax=Eiseniibacteriota bacterium TaxID=2212470 RepID=A0A849SS21_UNCEI|nr:CRTAC1 family protein [Candidatus Eisenbacteria bacterium]
MPVSNPFSSHRLFHFAGRIFFVLAVTLACPVRALAQPPVFTRVTGPNNPIVTDALQSAGGSWTDLDGDGFLDLIVLNGITLSQSNSLYLHASGMSFLRVVTGDIPNDAGPSNGGVWGDYDQDGHTDLFVARRNNAGNLLYRGLGDTAFVKVTAGAVVTDLANSNSGSWVDIDRDGDLDLYVVNFQGDDFLYLNGGAPDWPLTRTLVPTLTPGNEFSIHGAWADFDGDCDEDLFVGNAGSQNDYLFVNGGDLTFTKRGFPDQSSTLGASWADFDADGDLDLFVANFLHEFSILYRNSGAPAFTLTPVPTSVYVPDAANSVGSAWGDIDNDGDLDLFVANDGEPSALYRNAGPPGFALTRATSGAEIANIGNSFGCSFADVDRDGALDLWVANRLNQPNFLYHNDGPVGGWAAFRCVGSTPNRSGVGARLRVLATIGGSPRWQMQEVMPLSGYNSQNLELHFGIGGATQLDSVLVNWPSGARDTFTAVPAGRLITITEHQALVGVETPNPARARLRITTRNPFRGAIELAYELTEEALVTLEVIDLGGRKIATLDAGRRSPGLHRSRFEAPANLRPGLYWARLDVAGAREVVGLTLLR